MITRARHLQEERLFDSYMAERQGDGLDPPVAEHLADCQACTTRYAELAAFMDGLRREGDAEADALFTPERLRAQQRQIARRLALVGRPARVISFPGRVVRRTIAASTSRTAPRRIAAAAAAAGLLLGAALGASYQFEWGNAELRRRPVLTRDTASARGARVSPAVTRDSGGADMTADVAERGAE